VAIVKRVSAISHEYKSRGGAYMDESKGWNNILSSAYITAVTYGSSILKDTGETMC
jgi:hypothetical protein